MSTQPEAVLIAGSWRPSANPVGTFQAVDPASKSRLPEHYPVSGRDDVDAAIEAGAAAAAELSATSPDVLARFLDDYAARIETAAERLIEVAHRETGLAVSPRLRSVELPRTTNQLRQGAAAARDRSWCRATIDTKVNLRSKHAPLGGPVVVFGPNNFPYAFNSVAGGDFVAAIAAGNPVIGKANTGHPGTSKLLAELLFEALRATGLPPATVQLIYRTPPDLGFRLVSHSAIGATGFTGSKRAGLQLKQAADNAGKPIYLEMSSTNPVFVLPGALDERGSDIAKELFESCTLGAGQFCTRPGITVLVGGAAADTFLTEVALHFGGATPGTLLGSSGVGAISDGIGELVRHGAEVVTGGKPVEGPRYAFANTLLRVEGEVFLAHPHALQTEAFGTVTMAVLARDVAEMRAIAVALEGNLTGAIYSHSQGADDESYGVIERVLRTRVGRLLNDKMPTGVAVSPAMNHGGPYPATGHPGFTAVGVPASLLRFAALHCYDNVRPHRWPQDLQNRNPTGTMWRLIDGEWSQRDIAG